MNKDEKAPKRGARRLLAVVLGVLLTAFLLGGHSDLGSAAALLNSVTVIGPFVTSTSSVGHLRPTGRRDPARGTEFQTPPNSRSGLDPLIYVSSLTYGLRSPARIAITVDGTLLVTDPALGHVARFDASGAPLPAWPVAGGPLGIAVHPDGLRIFISLRDERKVAIYNYISAHN